jgi:hypothetical protein
MNRLHDLLFVIGLFLSIVGGIVLLTSFMGGSDMVQGIHVNLVGGGVMFVIGLAMIGRSVFGKQEY